jgi:hypothetical protein
VCLVEIGRRVARGIVAFGRLDGRDRLSQFELRSVAIDSRGGARYRQRREDQKAVSFPGPISLKVPAPATSAADVSRFPEWNMRSAR